MMLVHIGKGDVATRIHNAWLRVIEEGIHPQDIFTEGVSRERTGTREFAEAVVARLGQSPHLLLPVSYASSVDTLAARVSVKRRPAAKKDLVGVDVFLHWRDGSPDKLGELLSIVGTETLGLTMITNRGVKVWPYGMPETFCTDHWRCRFLAGSELQTILHADIIGLLQRIDALKLDFIKCENLCNFDGEPGFALGQGQ